MFPHTIRPIRPEEDAAEFSQLVKKNFRPWLDQDNMDYLDRLFREGISAQSHPLLTGITGFPFSLEGLVCRDINGPLLGVISTYFFLLNGRRCCLIANVCVDPAHRHEGIASRMLEEAERIRAEDGVRNFFLQARLSSPETVDFYRKRGYLVTDYREAWVAPRSSDREPLPSEYTLERVPTSDIVSFQKMLSGQYPPTVLWNLNYTERLFRTGIAAEAVNLLEAPQNRFRRVVDGQGRNFAWAAWQKLSGFADQLWMVPNGELSVPETTAVLRLLKASYKGNKALKIDVPAGGSADPFRAAGFSYWQTLAWMWKKL